MSKASDRLREFHEESNDAVELVYQLLGKKHLGEIICCPLICRIVVIVDDRGIADVRWRRDQLTNLDAFLGEWDLELTTQKGLERLIERAVSQFSRFEVDHPEDLASQLVGEGFLCGADIVAFGAVQLADSFFLELPVAERIIEKARSLDR